MKASTPSHGGACPICSRSNRRSGGGMSEKADLESGRRPELGRFRRVPGWVLLWSLRLGTPFGQAEDITGRIPLRRWHPLWDVSPHVAVEQLSEPRVELSPSRVGDKLARSRGLPHICQHWLWISARSRHYQIDRGPASLPRLRELEGVRVDLASIDRPMSRSWTWRWQ